RYILLNPEGGHNRSKKGGSRIPRTLRILTDVMEQEIISMKDGLQEFRCRTGIRKRTFCSPRLIK
ncbi:hypothetical protein SK128_005349, partial [Halocaridina rubra]